MSTAIAYRLLLVQPTVVFAARVNQATLPADAAQVTFDGVTTGHYYDVRIDMMVLFGSSAGADDYGRARVRKETTEDTLFIGWASRGTGEGEAYLLNDAYITVIDLYKPWTKNPRIDDDGEQYIDYDGDFFTYMHTAPIVNLDCGTARQADLDPETDLATFAFNAVNTYMTDPDAAAMYQTFVWSLPAGATVTDGDINTHQVTFTLPEGAHWVTAYEISDEGGVGIRHVLCVAGEPDGTLTKFDQLELSRRADGQTLRVRVSESVPESTYPNGCLCVLWKHQYEDGVEVTPSGLSGHEHIVFTGWHYSDEMDGRATERGYIDDTTLEFRDLGGWLQTLPGYPITMNRDQEPVSWFEMKRANIDYAIARVLLMYSNACNLTDFHWSGVGYDHYPFPSLASQGSTLFEMVDYFARAIAHTLTCDQWNRLHIKPDPQLLDSAGGATPVARTATVQKALTTADWSELRITETPFPRHNWNWGEAVVAKSVDADAHPQIDVVFCVAPGRAPSQGTATAQTGEQLTTTQAEFNARVGHAYARDNNPTSGVEVTLTSPDDFAIQPAYKTWVTLSTSAATAGQRGRVYSAARVLPAEVAITHDAERGPQTVRVTGERETSGTPAATYYPPSNDYGDVPPWTPPDPVTPPASDWELGPGVNRLFLIHESGELSITSTFLQTSSAGGPGYTVVDLSLDGTVLDAVTDPYSPLYVGTGTTVNAWVVTATRIYYVEDVAGVSSRSVTSQHTFAVETDYRTIQTERGVANWVIVSSYYQAAGVKATYTTNGTSWTEVTVSTGTFNDDSPDILAGSGSTTLFVESASMWMDTPTATGTDPSTGWFYFSYGFAARSGYSIIGAWFTLENYAGGRTVKRMSAGKTGSPGGYTELWDDTSDELSNSNYVAVAQWAAYTPAQVKDYINASYTALTNTEKNPITAGNSIWAGFQEGWPGTTFNWNMTVRLIGYGTPPAGGGVEGVVTPTVYVSGKVPGTAYIGAVSGSAGKLYKTVNYGASWVAVNLPASDFGQSLGGAIHWPWHNNSTDRLYYWGKFASNAYYAYRTESDGTTKTLITPASGYGPADPKAWSTSATNRQIVALMSSDGTNVRGDISQDAGYSWSNIVPATALASGYTGVHVADDTGVLYLWGGAGVALTGANGLSRDDRTGDASSSPVVAIGGW